MIGLLHVYHEHEVPYNNYIDNCNHYTFDKVIENKVFIEVAGILTRHQFESRNPGNSKMKIEYLNTLLKKVELCNNNNLNLIIIFYQDKMPKVKDILLKKLNASGITINIETNKNEGYIIYNKTLDCYINSKKYSNEELKNNIISFYSENGRLPYLHEMKMENHPLS